MQSLHERARLEVEARLDITQHPAYSEESPDAAYNDIEWLRENVFTLAFDYLCDCNVGRETAGRVAREVRDEMYPKEN